MAMKPWFFTIQYEGKVSLKHLKPIQYIGNFNYVWEALMGFSTMGKTDISKVTAMAAYLLIGYFDGILHSIHGFLVVLKTGLGGHNGRDLIMTSQ